MKFPVTHGPNSILLNRQYAIWFKTRLAVLLQEIGINFPDERLAPTTPNTVLFQYLVTQFRKTQPIDGEIVGRLLNPQTCKDEPITTSTIGSDAWESILTNNIDDSLSLGDRPPLHAVTYQNYSSCIGQSLIQIGKFDSGHLQEIKRNIENIKICRGKNFFALSCKYHLGTIFIGVPSRSQLNLFSGAHDMCIQLHFIEQIVHENAHQILIKFETLNRLYQNPNQSRIFSPLRAEKRSDRGVLHAFFVIARLLNFYQTLKRSDNNDYSTAISRRIQELILNFHALRRDLTRVRLSSFTPIGNYVFQLISNYGSKPTQEKRCI